jgi:hypothetical protein
MKRWAKRAWPKNGAQFATKRGVLQWRTAAALKPVGNSAVKAGFSRKRIETDLETDRVSIIG